ARGKAGKGGLETGGGVDHGPVARGEHRAELRQQPLFRRRREEDPAARVERVEVLLTNGAGKLEVEPERRIAAEIADLIGKFGLTLAAQPLGKIEHRRLDMDGAMLRRNRRNLHEAADIERA